MKAQLKTTAGSGRTSQSSGRLSRIANSANCHSASGQPAPAARLQEASAIEEHHSAQRKTEKRAHALRCAHGCAPNITLNDWTKAERDVLAEFAAAQVQSRPMPPASLFRLASLL